MVKGRKFVCALKILIIVKICSDRTVRKELRTKIVALKTLIIVKICRDSTVRKEVHTKIVVWE